jgi:hypothetical protein
MQLCPLPSTQPSLVETILGGSALAHMAESERYGTREIERVT